MRILRQHVCALLLLLCSCGDPLVESGFRGIPLLSFEGLISDIEGAQTLRQLSLSIFWTTTGESTTDPTLLIEQDSLSVGTVFPSTFKINVFGVPPDEVLASVPDSFAVGFVLVYADEDSSGDMSSDELRGAAQYSAILYVPSPLTQQVSPTNRPLEAGYHVVRLPLPCGHDGAFERGDEECGVNLGAACKGDGDCAGVGICRTELPNGYCVLREAEDGCRPHDGVLGPPLSVFGTSTASLSGDELLGDWMAACTSDEMCRNEEGYACPPWLGACFPQVPVTIEVGPFTEILNVCPIEEP